MSVSWECQEELFRQEVENADDLRLSQRLFKKCMGDKKKFCADIKFGTLHLCPCCLFMCTDLTRDDRHPLQGCPLTFWLLEGQPGHMLLFGCEACIAKLGADLTDAPLASWYNALCERQCCLSGSTAAPVSQASVSEVPGLCRRGASEGLLGGAQGGSRVQCGVQGGV